MTTPTGPSYSHVQLPLLLLALATAIFLGAQIMAVNRSGKTMRWQLTNLDKQIVNHKDSKKQASEAIIRREEQVKQSNQVQEQYMALLNEVVDLSATDEGARKVVQKWGIRRQSPPAGTDTKEPSKPEAEPEAKP